MVVASHRFSDTVGENYDKLAELFTTNGQTSDEIKEDAINCVNKFYPKDKSQWTAEQVAYVANVLLATLFLFLLLTTMYIPG